MPELFYPVWNGVKLEHYGDMGNLKADLNQAETEQLLIPLEIV